MGKRIICIDTAKGFGILVVLMGHIVPDILKVFPLIFCFWIPLFLFLSGMLFKGGVFLDFISNKTRTLLLPFVGWYILSYVIIGIVKLVKGDSLEYVLMKLGDIFITNDIFNISLWFLLALYWENLIFYFLLVFVKNKKYIILPVFFITGCGLIMNYFSIFNFLYIGSAMSCLPYFYGGYIINETIISLDRNKAFKLFVYLLILCCILAFISVDPPRLVYYNNTIASGNIFSIYLYGFLLVIAIILFCKSIGRIPFVTWLGENSLIILVSHLLFAPFIGTILMKLLPSVGIINIIHIRIICFIIVLSVMLGFVPLCIRFVPFICAVKRKK